MKAKPGDIIVITNKSFGDMYGKRCIVISFCDKPFIITDKDNDDGYVWARVSRDVSYGSFWLRSSSYEIETNCPDCNGTGQIQLFTSTVKCRCSV